MRTIRIALVLSLIGVAPAVAQDAVPAPNLSPSRTTVVRGAQAQKPPSRHRRFRIAWAVTRMVREAHAQSLISVPTTVHIENEVVGGAVAGGLLGALALSKDCEPAPGKCPVVKYLGIGAGAGAILAAIVADQRDRPVVARQRTGEYH